MKSTTTSGARKGIDFKRIAQDFKGLDPNDPGLWPASPRVAVFIGLLVATIAAFWWFDWRDQVATLEQRQAEEVQLRESWVAKKRQAVNLEEHRRQLAEIDFGGGRVQGDHGLEQGEALLDGEGGALVAANDPVGLEDVDGGGVLQGAPVEGDFYPLLSVEATNQGLHGFGELLALLPRLQVVLVGH